jgi:hypothetical protein
MSTNQCDYAKAASKDSSKGVICDWADYEDDDAFAKLEQRVAKAEDKIDAEICELGRKCFKELLVYIAEQCNAKGDDLVLLREAVKLLKQYVKQEKDLVKIPTSSTRGGEPVAGCSLPKIGIVKAESQINANCSYGQCKNTCAFLKDGEVKIGLHMCSIHLQSECGFELPHIAKAAKATISPAKVQYLYTGLDERAQALNPKIIICDLEEEANIKAKHIAKCENCSGNAYTTNKKEGVPPTVVVCGRRCKKCTIEYVKASPCPECEKTTFGRVFTRQCIDHTFLASTCKGHGGGEEEPQLSV